MGDKEIRVTDKRMFTPEGELKEEYRFLESEATAATAADAPPAESAPEPAAAVPAGPSISGGRVAGPPPEEAPRNAAAPRYAEAPWDAPPPGYEPAGRPPLELPGTPPGMGAPTFFDLAAILAEPVALYLGDMALEDGETAENLEMARLHIDLLDVLRQKTAGNLTAQEAAFLEDLLYRLRVRYVQRRG